MSAQKEKTAQVNLGLAVSGALLQPGETRSLREIAAFCDCHHNLIKLIEQNALKKIRTALSRVSQENLRDELHVHLRH